MSLYLCNCLTAGTHGSIKTYDFPVSKNVLQKAVIAVIDREPNIQVAPITDTFNSRYYNDGERYLTINIAAKGELNEYVIQYTGEKDYWDTSKTSQISIAYAFDKHNNGGSEGNGKFSSYGDEIKNKIISLFESEFINKIDTILLKSK